MFIYLAIVDNECGMVVVAATKQHALELIGLDGEDNTVEFHKLGVVTADVANDVESGVVCVSG